MLCALASFLGLTFLSRALGLLIQAGMSLRVVYDGARANVPYSLICAFGSDLLAHRFGKNAGTLQGSAERAVASLQHALVLPLTYASGTTLALCFGDVCS